MINAWRMYVQARVTVSYMYYTLQTMQGGTIIYIQ